MHQIPARSMRNGAARSLAAVVPTLLTFDCPMPRSPRAARVFPGRRGAVSTEYVVLVGTVGLALVFALVAVGPKLVKAYGRTRAILASPFP